MMGRNGWLPGGGGVGGGVKGGFGMAWIRGEKPRWANVINVMSINPAAMRAVDDLNKAIASSCVGADADAGGGYRHGGFGSERMPLLNDGAR